MKFSWRKKQSGPPVSAGLAGTIYHPVAEDMLRAYRNARPQKHLHTFCQAPLNNMYFSWEGKIIACCYNQEFILGHYPEQSIKEIWTGEKANELRDRLQHNDLTKGCDVCYRDLANGRVESVNAQRFDWFPVQDYPSMMEFQLTNTCNLECVMCDGHLSSAIRANREKLPAIPHKYDARFVEQLEEFIPHLQYTTFSGGEPFLIKIYYDIWEQFARLNPECTIKVITNGTIFNERVKSIIEQCRFYITISLDSPVKETYERIRKGASFDAVMANALLFRDYCQVKGTEFNFNFCPMTDNWQEIPEFITLCNSMDIVCHFNTVQYPVRHSLMYLTHPELEKIIAYITAAAGTPKTTVEKKNHHTLQEFIKMLQTWAARNRATLPSGKLDAADMLELMERKITEWEREGKLYGTEHLRNKIHQVLTAKNLEGMLPVPFARSLAGLTPETLQQVSELPVEEMTALLRKQIESADGG